MTPTLISQKYLTQHYCGFQDLVWFLLFLVLFLCPSNFLCSSHIGFSSLLESCLRAFYIWHSFNLFHTPLDDSHVKLFFSIQISAHILPQKDFFLWLAVFCTPHPWNTSTVGHISKFYFLWHLLFNISDF